MHRTNDDLIRRRARAVHRSGADHMVEDYLAVNHRLLNGDHDSHPNR